MEEFFIDDDGIRLHAKLDRPEGKDRCPLVLLFHGFTGHMEERHLLAVMETFLKKGFAVLRVESYGHGMSGGSFHDHTLYKWVSGGLRAIHYVEENFPFVTDLYVSGHSQGGLLTMLLAGLCPDKIKAIIPLSPAWMIPEAARSGVMLGQSFDPGRPPRELVFKDMTLGEDYLRVASSIFVEPFMERFKGKVYIVHGTKDEAVPYYYGEKARALYSDAVLYTIEGDDHCYNHHLEKVVEAVDDICDRL